MMVFRLCAHTNSVCNCNDAEMQPCLAAVIEEYLDTIRWSVLTDGIDGGPGDGLSLSNCHHNLRTMTHAEDSLAALKQWLAAGGINLWSPDDWKSKKWENVSHHAPDA